MCIGWMACLAQPTILRGCAEDCHCVMLRHFIALMLVCAMLIHCTQHMSVAAGPAAFSTCFTVERAEGCSARLGLHRVAAAILGGSAPVSKHISEHPWHPCCVQRSPSIATHSVAFASEMSDTTLWSLPRRSDIMLPVVPSCATCAVLVCGLRLLLYFLPYLLWGKLPTLVHNTGVTLRSCSTCRS